jgi:hypothetical protein
MIRALMVLMLLAASVAAQAQSRNQGETAQAVYASIQNDIRREFDAVMDRVGRVETNDPTMRLENIRQMWGMLYYNRAAMFAICAAEAEQYRSPGAPRVSARNNLFLNTCMEEKAGRLNKFTNLFSYASTFFPDRIDRCGEAVRLREQEQLLPAYEFLQFAEPKLYDFARYNACLMTNEATSPAAR